MAAHGRRRRPPETAARPPRRPTPKTQPRRRPRSRPPRRPRRRSSRPPRRPRQAKPRRPKPKPAPEHGRADGGPAGLDGRDRAQAGADDQARRAARRSSRCCRSGGALALGIINKQDARQGRRRRADQQVNELGASIKSDTEEQLKTINGRIDASSSSSSTIQQTQNTQTQDIASAAEPAASERAAQPPRRRAITTPAPTAPDPTPARAHQRPGPAPADCAAERSDLARLDARAAPPGPRSPASAPAIRLRRLDLLVVARRPPPRPPRSRWAISSRCSASRASSIAVMMIAIRMLISSSEAISTKLMKKIHDHGWTSIAS